MTLFKKIWNQIEHNDDYNADDRLTLKSILTGRIFVHGWVRKQYKLLILITILFLFYINNDYYCQRQEARIVALQRELTLARYESLTVSATYTEMCKESTIICRLQERGIPLKQTTQPLIYVE